MTLSYFLRLGWRPCMAMLLNLCAMAVAGEALGQRHGTDIPAVSLSGHDFVNHSFSAESRISQDHLLQLDRLLQGFFHDLDAAVGKGNYIAILSADHGFMPATEFSAALGRDADRLNPALLLDLVNQGLAKRYGAGQWALNYSGPGILLNKPLMAQHDLNVDRVVDLEFALKLSGTLGWGASGSTRGSPYPLDMQVPVLFYGPRWVQPGRIDTPVEVAGIAPTLARLLGVAVPVAAEGKPLPLQAP